MSVAAIGSSDAYARYRQQQLSLLTSLNGSTAAQSSSNPVPFEADQTAAKTYASRFKADLSTLNDRHHHAQYSASSGAPSSAGNTADNSDSANSNPSQDSFKQTMDQLVGLLNVAAKVASIVI
ncbi:hypothetical protein [Hyphomicrobium sp.]|uniref:hypothetical protein n=1 Tax=Hyphomicrobium sp. TaxID=82 RepID=UPI000FB0E846|nr:hypothetical protein [Hyphomicrobium sp.]RUO99477.1 MAG: hypothetical protein EKK30_06165 [Hyphomicrobium sp.]